MAEAQWYYLEDGQQKGPVSDRSLLELVIKKILSPSTKVWSPTATQGWQSVDSIPQLRKQLQLSAIIPKTESDSKRRAYAPTEAKATSGSSVWADKSQEGLVTTQKKGFNWLNLVIIVALIGSVLAAFAFKDKLEQQFPDLFAQLYMKSGTMKCQNNDTEEAIKEFKQVIKLRPAQAEAYFHKGAAEIKTGNTRDAWPDFQQAVKIDPKYVPAYYGIAYLEADTGNYNAAIKDLNQALVLDDKFADAYYGRGLMREKMGSRAGAIVDLETAAKLFSARQLDKKAERVNAVIKELKDANAATDKPAPQLKWQEKGDCLAHDLAL